ncbi:urea carboxylase [Terrihabitans soli]|uniref:Urea carboxylase n=1 Tax=Terrihabitans soli TaxID=708113 RepID=A0A6S6QRS9_9HYPH|nr:urea carboxylase [Terrihabitans soli]BCJ92326.1 urea carboxylase [Terrihabitans soli]
MFRKVLIANRGAIACRVIRTLDRMGIASVAVYSEADRHSLHVARAGEAVLVGPPPAAQSYLDAARILDAAKRTGAEAIHPGYGFLSENPDFAEACAREGIVFIGPGPEHMRAFGLKHKAREIAEKAGVPLAPGGGLVADLAAAELEAKRIGFPVMIKSTAGGGGIGLQLCRSADEFTPMFERVQRLAANNFKDAGIFLEKFIARGRHIEVQIFGDGKGKVLALGERDCSAQRRNQKVIEETPAPNISDEVRARLLATAERLGEAVNYANAGTVEFLYDVDGGEFYFLEVNTRLQVEHGVTEEVTGVDLVEWMLRQAAGETIDLVRPASKGHSIQVRLYAEDPGRNFRPSAGRLTEVSFPKDARIETWVEAGAEVPPFYDPMIAKLIVTAENRPAALKKLSSALEATKLGGIETNRDYLKFLAVRPELAAGEVTTRLLETLDYRPATVEVVAPGTQTTVQDFPGRLGFWDVGVPPSGPMDHLSFRLANRALGNDPNAAALEITLSGPTLKFDSPAVACLTGAAMSATLDGEPVPFWIPFEIKAGQILKTGSVTGAGTRAYLAVAGGFQVPDYLGSKATFTLGGFGGHGGRALLAGDVLHLDPGAKAEPRAVPDELRPAFTRTWRIGVLYGPHGAPDFFTEEDIAAFFAADWEVHYNSSRTGVRLIGPKPKWARSDGGEAGLHPSNIHDNAYAIGAVDFTGDMPVILGPDGPSLGGFVCPVTIAQAELWKMGQLRPGDRISFKRLSPTIADQAEADQSASIAKLEKTEALPVADAGQDDAILGETGADRGHPRVVYRRQGDRYILVEYGPLVLDLELRFRVHALMQAVQRCGLKGIVDLTPGIRSLQIHYDPEFLPLGELLNVLKNIEAVLPGVDEMEVPTRIVHLPLSWDDEDTQLAIRKYMQSVRPDAPWCPSNIEFIRRINGLGSIDEVKRIVFEASYLVLGLGDVYLGAPVATPLDPRHRLVTTKYNPARTWTPENAVGIGGAYMCVYGMEGPGGYQFVGRTCQVWNTFRTTHVFEAGKPWLLRFFDQIRFYEVSHDDLMRFREDFPHGKAEVKIEHGVLKLADYRRFMSENAKEISAFTAQRQAAFMEERARWEASGQIGYGADIPEAMEESEDALPEGGVAVTSPIPGSVWKVNVAPGTRVKAGEALIVVESMKTEFEVAAPADGTVSELRCAEGRAVGMGQILAVIVEDRA